MATRISASSQLPTGSPIAPASLEAAQAYDLVGEGYLRYADGDLATLFDFSSRYAFADRQIWLKIDATLRALMADGQDEISILDAGCGPGTWVIRTVTQARRMGFRRVKARGFDISPEMIRLARENAGTNPDFHFEVADLEQPLDEPTASADLVLCLYGVLNHLPCPVHAQVARELARVASGHLLITVRTVGSLPTIYVDALEKASHFHQDHGRDRFEVDLIDGRHLTFASHQFCAAEFQDLFAPLFDSVDLTGLDIFHSRFALNRDWNPDHVPYEDVFEQELCKLEDRCGRDAAFIDRAAHIILHGRVPR